MADDEKYLINNIYEVSKLLFDKIEIPKSLKNFKVKKKLYVITCTDEIFDSESLYKIGVKIKRFVEKYRFFECKFILDLRFVEEFSDKNTYLILELLVYYLLYCCTKINFHFIMDIKCNNLTGNGLKNTTLYKVGKNRTYINQKDFINTYLKSDFTIGYYRRLISNKSLLENDNLPSLVYTDVSLILKDYCDEEWTDEISEVVSEIVSNACSHNKSFLLIDIDYCDLIKGKEENHFKGINISILNIGENLIYEKIMDNVKNQQYETDDPIYAQIYEAYHNHLKMFDSEYTQESFFTITAFQKWVTSRYLKSGNSGTGLTRLLQHITGKTEEEPMNYVLSGTTVIRFISGLLNVSDEGFAGFNSSNNYISEMPDKRILYYSGLFVPGTVYQFHLVRRDFNDKN